MSILPRLLRLYRPYWKWAALGLLASVATLLGNLGLMAVAGWFIASMAIAGAAGVTMNYFTPAAIIRACAILRTLGRYLERLTTHEATLRFLSGLRVWFYQHLEPLAPAGLEYHRSGDLLSRIRADIDALAHFYLRVLVPVGAALLVGLVLLLILFQYHPLFAMTSLAFLVSAGVLLPWWSWRLGREPGRHLNEQQAALRVSLVDNIQGMEELLVYGAADASTHSIDRLSQDIGRHQETMSRLAGASQAAVSLSAGLALWCTVLIGVALLRDAGLAPAELPMLALLTLAGFEAVAPLPIAFHRLGHTLSAARRLFDIIDQPPPVRDPQAPSPSPRDSSIEFRDVLLHYGGEAKIALQDIDFHVPPGHRLGIVGATGSGKTSLLQLLLRFREPRQGSVRVGGEDIADYAGEDLRRQFAVVSQHGHLFNASIGDNLRLGNPEAGPDEMQQACRAAQIHEFIAGLPDGYATWVGESGVRLSGGEAQRLLIARALLKDSPIILLDEPTEGLDAPTERALMRTLLEATRGRTLVLVTHRLAGLEAMDEILVLDAGRIIERGSHPGLLSRDSRYRALHELLGEPLS